MVSDTIQFVSQTKLGELHRQRSALLAEYQKLAASSSEASGVECLRILRHGLKQICVANKPLHVGLQDLDVLLQGSSPPESIVQFWLRRLNGELERGKLRADIVYLFGALLGEWDENDKAKHSFVQQRSQAHQEMLSQLAIAPTDASLQILPEVLAPFRESNAEISEAIEQELQNRIDEETSSWFSLNSIAQNPHHPADVRLEAKRFADDGVLQRELGDALRVAARDPNDWTWPTDGVNNRALWTRNKWRLYPMLSLVQLCLLDCSSSFWTGALETKYSSTLRRINRKGRLQYLQELQAPDVITFNERRMLKLEEERVDLGWYERVDPWDGLEPLREDVPVKGIVMKRAAEQGELRESSAMGYYYGAGVNKMVHLVHAELNTLRAAYPDRPLFIVKLDIQDFFASVPHETLVGLLRHLGMPESGVTFVKRYLQVPYTLGGKQFVAQRGVPMEQSISHWMCEWLLRVMERYVHSKSKVRIIRQIDDICLLTPHAEDAVNGWHAVHQFLTDCGLSVNAAKCGSVALNGDLPQELPAAPPQWGMLRLTADGQWVTDEPSFEKFLTDTRELIQAKEAILAKVMTFNSHLKFLVSSLGLAMDLGDAHRASINETLDRFDSQFFSDQQGIRDGILDCIQERYLNDTQLNELPESWMLWPITAGGLSLRSANVLSGQFQVAYVERQEKRLKAPAERTDQWQYGDEDWTKFYEDQLVKLEPAPCRETKVMKSLVKSFIARGTQISSGKQEGLSEYWRWVLNIYGAEVLDKFGTFEFLLTDLVPLQLIHEKLMREDDSQ